MNHVIAERVGRKGRILPNGNGLQGPAATPTLPDALELLARHVAFTQAGQREGRDALALDLVSADIDRVLLRAGLTRRVDDRGDEWAERDGRPLVWLGHVAVLERSNARP